MMTTYKSIHIEGCWPYKYEAPKRRVFKRDTLDRANARRREQYHQKKKIMGLQVFSRDCVEMDIDICNRLNDASNTKSRK
jgi:hypothetical protein